MLAWQSLFEGKKQYGKATKGDTHAYRVKDALYYSNLSDSVTRLIQWCPIPIIPSPLKKKFLQNLVSAKKGYIFVSNLRHRFLRE